MNEIMVVRQLPIIEERLKEMSEEVEQRTRDAVSLAVTADTVKSVKAVRAELNAMFKSLEEERKEIKRKILQPYEEFDATYTLYVGAKFKEADAALKAKIDGVEGELKKEKESALREFFAELVSSERLEWLGFERSGVKVNLSATMTSLRKQVEMFVWTVANSVQAIENMPNKDEVLVEYKKSLDLGAALKVVESRKKAIEEEKARRDRERKIREAEAEAERKVMEAVKAAEEAQNSTPEPPRPVEAPVPKEGEGQDPVRTLQFTVTAPLSKLKALKQFLIEGGYEIG